MTHDLMMPAKAIAEYDFYQMPENAICDLIDLSVAAAKQNWALAGLLVNRPLEGCSTETPFFKLIELHLSIAEKAARHLICEYGKSRPPEHIEHAINVYKAGAAMIWDEKKIAA